MEEGKGLGGVVNKLEGVLGLSKTKTDFFVTQRHEDTKKSFKSEQIGLTQSRKDAKKGEI